MTFIKFFGEGGEESSTYNRLMVENANIQAGRILKDGLSDEEQARLDRQGNKADRTTELIRILEARGVAREYGDKQGMVLEQLVTNESRFGGNFGFDSGIYDIDRETGKPARFSSSSKVLSRN